MKTMMKSIFSLLTLSLFVVSAAFAQSDGTVDDAQHQDTYSQDGTMQEGTTQDDTYQQDDRYTTQDGMETQEYGTETQTGEQDENRTQIAQEELPTEVSDAIEEGEYANWTVAEAYEVNDQEETLYEIHFQNEQGQTEKEKFKQDGEVAR